MPIYERQQVYCPDALVAKARENGLKNLSEFFRVSLKEYVDKAQENAAKQNSRTTPIQRQV